MIPFLLDTLTVVFIVGSLVLLWVTVRSGRLFYAPIVRAPEVDFERLATGETASASDGKVDAESCRARAEECLEQAERSTNQNEKATWLRMGVEWIKLSQATDRSGGEPAPNDEAPESSIPPFLVR